MPSETAVEETSPHLPAPGARERFQARLREVLAQTQARRPEADARVQQLRREAAAVLAPYRQAIVAEELRRMCAPRKVSEEWMAGLLDETHPPVVAAKRFVAHSDRTFLVLRGGVGSGKTSAACIAAAEVPHAFVLEVPLLEMTRTYSEEMERMLWRARTAPLLVLNEMGTGPVDTSGYSLQKLDYVLGARYDRRAKCIITTNLTEADFYARYEKRIEDRVRETGVFFNCGDRSLRQRSP